jgi:RimJ/RimL family protein N-acetyltransferase
MPGPEFLRGESVTLNTIEEADLEFIQRVTNDPDVWLTLGNARPYNDYAEQEWYEEISTDDDDVVLLICADGDPAGFMGLHDVDNKFGTAELGHWVAPEHQGQGYATDAARTIVEYGFDHLRLHKINAHVYDFNEPSWRMLESVGFQREGTLREGAFVDGAYVDVLRYGVLATDLS